MHLFIQEMDMIVCKTLGYFIFFHIRYALLAGLTIRGTVMLLTSPKAICDCLVGLKTLAATRQRSCAGVHSQPPTQRRELSFTLWFQ